MKEAALAASFSPYRPRLVLHLPMGDERSTEARPLKNLLLFVASFVVCTAFGCKAVPVLSGAAGMDPVDFKGGLAGTWEYRSGSTKNPAKIVLVPHKKKAKHYRLFYGGDGKAAEIAELRILRPGDQYIVEIVGNLSAAGGMATVMGSMGLAVPTHAFVHLRAFGSTSVSRVEIRAPRAEWFNQRLTTRNRVVIADGRQITRALNQATFGKDQAFSQEPSQFHRISTRYDEATRNAVFGVKPKPKPRSTPAPKTRPRPRATRPAKNPHTPRRPPSRPASAGTFRGKLALPMVWIRPGQFKMGSGYGEGASGEHPRHDVKITRGFYMAKYETRQRDYMNVIGDNPSEVEGADLPVESLSWRYARWFCEVLTKRERKAGRLPAGWSYRLPTEAEWEYACRAGGFWSYSFGSRLRARQANFGRQRKSPIKVGSYPANAWGLHDMHGNVAEFCADRRRYFTKRQRVDPFGTRTTDPTGKAKNALQLIMEGARRVVRGGSYVSDAKTCRSASRDSASETAKNRYTGFRVVLSPTPAWLGAKKK